MKQAEESFPPREWQAFFFRSSARLFVLSALLIQTIKLVLCAMAMSSHPESFMRCRSVFASNLAQYLMLTHPSAALW